MRQVAHDLNNHIAALVSFADLVLDDLPPQHALRERIESIRTLGGRAAIRSLPDAARVAQVAEHVSRVCWLAYAALADVPDPHAPLYADLLEIALAAESALSVVSGRVRDAA